MEILGVPALAGYVVIVRGNTFTVGIASRWAVCEET